MNIVAIVQARMGSSRLPGKILKSLGDKSVFEWVYERLKKSTQINTVLFATTDQSSDDIFCERLTENEIDFIRGSEHDVLGRFYVAACEASADIIVRVTCDCPFIDPKLIDEGILMHLQEGSEYTSNVVPPTFPDGFDFEVFSIEILETAHHNAESKNDREHVTPWIIKHSKGTQSNVTIKDESLLHANKRVTLDHAEDFLLLKTLVENYGINLSSTVDEIITTLDFHPELLQINQRHDARKK